MVMANAGNANLGLKTRVQGGLFKSAFVHPWRRKNRQVDRFGVPDCLNTGAQIKAVPVLVFQVEGVDVVLHPFRNIGQMIFKPLIKTALWQVDERRNKSKA